MSRRRSRIFSLSLGVLFLLSVPCFSDSSSPTNAEIMAGIVQILAAQETISQKQDAISSGLEMTQEAQRTISERQDAAAERQSGISETLSTVVEKLLPNLDEQVKSQQVSFDAFEAKVERREAMLIGATAVAFIVAVLGLIF